LQSYAREACLYGKTSAEKKKNASLGTDRLLPLKIFEHSDLTQAPPRAYTLRFYLKRFDS
jgi:hypothetical protein